MGETHLAVRDTIHSSAMQNLASVFEQHREIQERVTLVIAPMVQAVDHIQQIMRPYLAQATQLQEMMESVTRSVRLPDISRVFEEKEMVYIVRPQPTIVRLDPDSVDEIIEKVVATLKRERQSVVYQEVTVPKAMVAMPEGATWADTELRFMNAHTLKVLCKEKVIGSYDYAALGFARKNTRDGKSDKQWQFLTQLSIIIETKIVKPTKANLSRSLGVTLGACEKLKENVSKKLQISFGITDDPFQKYDSVKGYRPKFTLTPEPLLRGDGEMHDSGTSLLDWKGYEEDELFS